MKSRIAVYIPVKSDDVDQKLAEYINNYPDRQKLKIMFMRESAGVYQFGQRRVQVKVERNKIQIKVGGGYLSIYEFLDQYTPVELERLERRDPLKKFSEKVAIQKTLGDKVSVETSPIRKRTDSAVTTKSNVKSGTKKQPLTKSRSANKLGQSSIANGSIKVSVLKEKADETALRRPVVQQPTEQKQSHNF